MRKLSFIWLQKLMLMSAKKISLWVSKETHGRLMFWEPKISRMLVWKQIKKSFTFQQTLYSTAHRRVFTSRRRLPPSRPRGAHLRGRQKNIQKVIFLTLSIGMDKRNMREKKMFKI